MKRKIIAIVCGCLLGTVASAQVLSPDRAVYQASFNHQNGDPNVTLCEAMVFLGCAAVGIWIYFKVAGTCPSQNEPETFVLQISTDGRGTWLDLATNTVRLDGQKPITFFTVCMTNDSAFYRVKWIKGGIRGTVLPMASVFEDLRRAGVLADQQKSWSLDLPVPELSVRERTRGGFFSPLLELMAPESVEEGASIRRSVRERHAAQACCSRRCWFAPRRTE